MEENGFHIPNIYLPRKDVDLSKWAVISCDQHSSNKEFWKTLNKHIGTAPSTLRMIHPEVYGTYNIDYQSIQEAMEEYKKTVLTFKGNSPVFIRRYHNSSYRSGILLALNLDKYRIEAGNQAPVRASERTVKERLPIRMKIRELSTLDLSHAYILVNDPSCSLIEGLEPYIKNELYDFSLSMHAGRISGHLIGNKGIQHINEIFIRLAEEGHNFSIVGDGNHHIASAKQVWEHEKQDHSLPKNHPLGKTLVEVINVHNPHLKCYPIHRVIKHINTTQLLERLCEHAQFSSKSNYNISLLKPNEMFYKDVKQEGLLIWQKSNIFTCIKEMDANLEDISSKTPSASIDYIHGEKETLALSNAPNTACIILPPVPKHKIFHAVSEIGLLPKKSFSLGTAKDKRHYLEVNLLYE